MDDVKEELLELLGNFPLELQDRMGLEPYFPKSSRMAAAALTTAIRSTDRLIMGRLDQHARARVLRVLREWVEDMGGLLPELERERRERHLRSPVLQKELMQWCAEVRAPAPDAQGPYCLVLVGMPDEHWGKVADHLGDKYQVYMYEVEGAWALGARAWNLGEMLNGLDGQTVHIVEVW